MWLEEALRERDLRYRQVLGDLNRRLETAKKENLQLKNGNHRLKIKYATSKVGEMLRSNLSQSSPSLRETLLQHDCKEIKPSEDQAKPSEDQKTVFEFSSADSLESTLSLVSGVRSQSEVTEVLVDPERGTREKKYRDGRREIWYSNGNRKEIGSDGKTVKVSDVNNRETSVINLLFLCGSTFSNI